MMTTKTMLIGVVIGVFLPVAAGAYTFFEEDFEGIPEAAPIDTSVDPPVEPPGLMNGMIVGANVFSADNSSYVGGYFGFEAPNISGPGARFCNIAVEQGGPEQGDKVLAVFSDYNNGAAQSIGQLIDANTYIEFVLEEADLGTTVTFVFDAKFGNFDPSPLPEGGFVPEAEAFLKVLNPLAGFATVLDDVEDASLFPTTWTTYTLTIQIPTEQVWVGRILQAGFRVKTSEYWDSTIYYDNMLVTSDRVEPEVGVIPIVDYGFANGEFFLEFESEDLKNYALQRRLPGGEWTTVDDIFEAFPGTETLFDPDAGPAQPTAIYQVIEIIE